VLDADCGQTIVSRGLPTKFGELGVELGHGECCGSLGEQLACSSIFVPTRISHGVRQLGTDHDAHSRLVMCLTHVDPIETETRTGGLGQSHDGAEMHYSHCSWHLDASKVFNLQHWCTLVMARRLFYITGRQPALGRSIQVQVGTYMHIEVDVA
jgi:hypothetical protein